MTRYATYAGALALTLVAFGASAQTSGQPNWAQSTPVDGHQLIAALDSCQHFAEESRRVRCETIARKTGGQATQSSASFVYQGAGPCRAPRRAARTTSPTPSAGIQVLPPASRPRLDMQSGGGGLALRPTHRDPPITSARCAQPAAPAPLY